MLSRYTINAFLVILFLQNQYSTDKIFKIIVAESVGFNAFGVFRTFEPYYMNMIKYIQ